jgi:aspartokinase-like uncharacterized kinase
MNSSVRVVKVGGSLFSYADMPDRVKDWTDRQSPGTTVFIGGGGDLVQPLRTAHERFRLSDEASHWLAVRAMTVTSRLLAKLLDIELVDHLETIEQNVGARRDTACVLDVEDFLRQREPRMAGCRLPCDWTCTGDAIAARVAEVLDADDMVLMKAVTYPVGTTLAAASRAGLVDGHFPLAAVGLRRIRWVNLVAPTPQEVELAGDEDGR